MFTIRKSLFKLTTRHFYGTTSVRSFLTEAYSCNEVWNERLQCSLLKKVDPEVLYNKLSTVLESDTKQMSSIDLDIFANSLTDEGYLDELEDLIHRFRLSAQTGTLLPSTHHAVVRYFLATKNEKDLIRILKDRLNYGIFPDYYLSNLLMDTFIKEKNFRNAAVIASNQMLQEEFDNDITKTMGLYSCLKYVTNPVDWEETKEEIEETSNEDDEEEDTRVRVDFLRNPYFDDHFDLSDGDHLVGKTMLAISKTDNSIIGNSFKTIGLAYYNQWNELAIFLRNIDSSVYLETVELAVTAIDKRTPENEKELKDALSKLKIENKSLTEETENAVKKAVSNTEENEIQIQSKVSKIN